MKSASKRDRIAKPAPAAKQKPQRTRVLAAQTLPPEARASATATPSPLRVVATTAPPRQPQAIARPSGGIATPPWRQGPDPKRIRTLPPQGHQANARAVSSQAPVVVTSESAEMNLLEELPATRVPTADAKHVSDALEKLRRRAARTRAGTSSGLRHHRGQDPGGDTAEERTATLAAVDGLNDDGWSLCR